MVDLAVSDKGHRVHWNYDVAAAPVAIAAENLSRKSIVIQNQGDAIAYLNAFGVTATGAGRGYALAPGATLTDDGSEEPWYACTRGDDVTSLHIIEVT